MEQIIEQKVNELFEKAKEKYDNEDYSGAIEIFGQIVKLDTKAECDKSGETLIYMVFCVMRSLSLNDFVGQKINEQLAKYQINIIRGLDNIKEKLGKNNRAYIDSWLYFYKEFINVILTCYNNLSFSLKKIAEAYTKGADYVMRAGGNVPFNQLQQFKLQVNDLYRNYKVADNNYKIAINLLIGINNLVTEDIIKGIEDYSLISSKELQEIYDNVAKVYHLDNSKDIHNEVVNESTGKLFITISDAKNLAKKYEIEEYWKDKPERKKELEDTLNKYVSEREEIEKEVDEIKTEIEQLKQNMNKPLEIDESRKKLITQNQNELIKQRNSLGLFKGKEKSSLQSRIDEIQVEINQLDTKIKTEMSKLRDKFQPTIDEKNQKIKELEKDIERLEQQEKLIEQELNLEDHEESKRDKLEDMERLKKLGNALDTLSQLFGSNNEN